MEHARVFNIERFATEDGVGIRTVIFLKGCSLRCKWCANPESQKFKKEILFNSRVCINCGKCIKICEQDAIKLLEDFGYITNADQCNYCEKCIDNCYANARTMVGVDYTLDELIEEIYRDKKYYHQSGGGVTFSGGEPLYYSSFIKQCAKILRKDNLTTLVETCGYVQLEKIKEICHDVDYIFYDIKHMDSQKHKELTGKGNEIIIDNLKWLCDNYKGKLSIRYPYIPDCNADRKSIEEFLVFAKSLKNIEEVVFLPYHRLGMPKYIGLGRVYEMGDRKSLKRNELKWVQELAKNYNLKVKIQ